MQSEEYRISGGILMKWYPKGETAVIPEGVLQIYDHAFIGCGRLRRIHIPDTVRRIGSAAFQACRNLEQIRLPEDLESIGDAAFSGCTALKALSLPAKIRRVPPLLCNNCTALEKVDFSEETDQIGWSAFSGCEKLENIDLPPKLRWIGEGAFSRCRGLTRIHLPNGLQRVDKGAFSGSRLQIADFPESMHRIDFTAITDCATIEMVIVQNPDGELQGYDDEKNIPLYFPKPHRVPQMYARNMLRGYAKMWQAGQVDGEADRFYTEYIQNRPKTVFLWALEDIRLLDLLAKKRLIPVLLAEEYMKIMTEKQNNEAVALLVEYLGKTENSPFDPTKAFQLD